MINYKEKKEQIDIDSKAWETLKTKSIIELTTNGQKSTLKDVEHYTIDKTIDEKVNKMLNELRNEDSNFVAIPPIIVIDGPKQKRS